MQVLFLQSHSTCFGRKRPSSGVFKTGTAATGTCVIVAGKSSHLLIRAGRPAVAEMDVKRLSAGETIILRRMYVQVVETGICRVRTDQ